MIWRRSHTPLSPYLTCQSDRSVDYIIHRVTHHTANILPVPLFLIEQLIGLTISYFMRFLETTSHLLNLFRQPLQF